MPEVSSDGTQLNELRSLVEQQIAPLIDWYQRKKKWPRRLHKASIALIILLGAAIPVASVLPPSTTTRILIGTAGVIITALSSLSASYDWHRKWRLFTLAQNRVESSMATWELEMIKARLSTSQTSWSDALTATETLFSAVNLSRDEETQEFFQDQRNLSSIAPERPVG